MLCNRSIRRYFIGSQRRWDRYNTLVDRVFDPLSHLFFRHWDMLLNDINRGKSDHSPYQLHSSSFLLRSGAMFNVPFKSLEIIARTYCVLVGIRSIHYPGIFKRIRKIRPILNDTSAGAVEAAIDSTGFKITIRGDYLGSNRNEREGWKKLHAVISINDVSVISFAITYDNVHDTKMGRKILESIKSRILKIFGDKAYDSKAIFNLFGSKFEPSKEKCFQ